MTRTPYFPEAATPARILILTFGRRSLANSAGGRKPSPVTFKRRTALTHAGLRAGCSPHEAQRNAGIPDCASLHPGYACYAEGKGDRATLLRSTASRFPFNTSKAVSLPSRKKRISKRRRPNRRSL